VIDSALNVVEKLRSGSFIEEDEMEGTALEFKSK
jgi:hypothetical protein